MELHIVRGGTFLNGFFEGFGLFCFFGTVCFCAEVSIMAVLWSAVNMLRSDDVSCSSNQRGFFSGCVTPYSALDCASRTNRCLYSYSIPVFGMSRWRNLISAVSFSIVDRKTSKAFCDDVITHCRSILVMDALRFASLHGKWHGPKMGCWEGPNSPFTAQHCWLNEVITLCWQIGRTDWIYSAQKGPKLSQTSLLNNE